MLLPMKSSSQVMIWNFGIETIVEGEIIEKGKIAIDAKLFSEIVRKLP